MQTFLIIALGIIAIIIIVEIAMHFRRSAKQASSNEAELHATLQHPDELRQLLLARKKIQAIKLYREETGANLQAAKRAVEDIEAQMGLGHEQAQTSTSYTGRGEDMEEVRRLIQAGQKINAIKLYRQITGVGLKEAKEAVDRMAAGTLEPSLPPQQSAQTRPDLVDAEKLQRLIREGHKIEAIKYFRQQRGVGLKEAKEAIDWLEANMHSQ
ncbi:MAG TPA: ribosomal protein L7/L12 [Ktedonobacteraceae bacterium]|nr:ribosomal protein L7/L12 [Ktedonobacteraceae bacterium]